MGARRKIILHIGAGKTGSSAIQRFLDLNVDALRRENIVVPDNDLALTGRACGNHVRIFRAWTENPVEGREALEAAMQAIFESVGDAATILLSAENLAAQKVAPSLFEGLVKNHDVAVILYIRRQDEFILSAWQQWAVKVQHDFLAWLIAATGSLGDWKTHLTNWERVIPREQITVRIFDRTRLENGDVIADFFKVLGLSTPFEAFAYPEKEANPSFDDAVMDLVGGNKAVFKDAHDNRFQEFIRDVTGDRYIKNSRESMLTAAQRLAIVNKYAASNLWVQKAYFKDQAGTLFAPIRERDYVRPEQRTMLRRQLGFIVAIVFGLYRGRRDAESGAATDDPENGTPVELIPAPGRLPRRLPLIARDDIRCV